MFVDDGSSDGTLPILAQLAATDRAVRVIALSRNFGHQTAVSAGIDNCTGAAVVVIDADLQDPPSVVREMIAKWRDGWDVVYARRLSRAGESGFKRGTASLFYRILNSLSEVPIPENVGDFRLMDRQVVDVLKSMPERNRFIRGMVSWIGFRQTAIDYHREARFAGVTKYPLRKMVKLAFDGIMSFSVAPIRLAVWVGLLSSMLAFAGILYAIAVRLFTDQWVEGWTLILVSILFIGGVQLIFLGLIGEYVGQIFVESKRRPLYIVSQRIGFGDK